MSNGLAQLKSIKSFPSLVKYLRDELDWDFETDEIEDLTYDYDTAEFNLDANAAAKIDEIKQLRPLVDGQPWGVFYLDFGKQRLAVSALRGILRGLVAKKRASTNSSEMRKWQIENLLFICTSNNFQNFNFSYFRGSDTNRAVLSTFGWQTGDTHLRTLAEYNLPALRFPADTSDTEGWLTKWRAAFDVEAVTDKFFADYRRVFEAVEKEVKASIKSEETARLYTQRLFNRLMFLYFIQKKGWLEYEGDKNYLRALFNAAESAKENFLRERLYYAFFWGMSNVGESRQTHTLEVLRKKRGDVPYLNGGLFDIEDDYDSDRDKVKISNDAFRHIINLFERYNFTVEESTPLNVQVAVDPEMLGKVFEELVTGRHESGSYYTPRQIVSFMCREALKHYLAKAAGDENAAARFVDEGDASGLRNPESVLEALRRVRVCDPACGSGAYLLGMMQELVRLRGSLFVSRRLGDDSAYKIKRAIIENNLYGVDKDPFAVQIAALRLWLSLAIDSEQPQPLPNLDFKIEQGDSLIAPAPSANEKTLFFNRRQQVRDYVELKRRFSGADGELKRSLRVQIETLRAEIAADLKHAAPRPGEAKIAATRKRAEELPQEIRAADRAGNKTKAAKLQKDLQTLKRQLEEWDKAGAEQETGFDWAVEFAEVFMPEPRETWRIDDLHQLLNDYKQQGTLIEDAGPDANTGGFDIVLANPPYVRYQLIDRDYKQSRLKPVYSNVFDSTADLYVYFFARASQLLKQGGVGAFITSNKWLRAGYGEKLRQYLLDAMLFHLVADFGELPVFNAGTFPAIFIWEQKQRENRSTSWAVVKNLIACYEEGVREHLLNIKKDVPASNFLMGGARLAASEATNFRAQMEIKGKRLGEIAENLLFNGIKTGLNNAFIIDQATYAELIKQDSKSKEILKLLLMGDDVRRYECHYRQRYLIRTHIGINIKRYPAVLRYLKQWQATAEVRDARGREWYELRSCNYYDYFEQPKIIYPDIGKESRFVLDEIGYHTDYTVFNIPIADWFLVGVLNSVPVWEYLKLICSALGDESRGGRLRFYRQYMETLPIPDAPTGERERIAELAREAQSLHTARRQRVEQFLRDAGTSPAASSSRNPLEQPWTLAATEFARRAPRANPQHFTDARDETLELTERIAKVEREIDERVAALYGLDATDATAPRKKEATEAKRPFN